MALKSALIRAIRLALLMIGVGSGLALLHRWGGLGAGLGAAVLIGLWQWRLSRDPFQAAFCVLTSCALAIAMLSVSAILWGDWRLGLVGIGMLTSCCLALFLGQAALEISPGETNDMPGTRRSHSASDDHGPGPLRRG